MSNAVRVDEFENTNSEEIQEETHSTT